MQPNKSLTRFVVTDALDSAECAALVTGAAAGLSATAVRYPPSYRDNDRWVSDDPRLAAELFARLEKRLPPALVDADGSRWRLEGLNERFRFCRYQNGQRFRVHRDGAHTDGARRSRLTLQIYLDDGDDFDGGRTRFYDARLGAEVDAVRPVRGTAIVFDHEWWHDGEAVTRGTKHIIRTDVMYVREEDAARNEPGGLGGHTGYVFGMCRLGDGTLVSSSRDRTLRVWSFENGAPHCTAVLTGHLASVHAVIARQAGGVVTASRDGTVRAWDLQTMKHVTFLEEDAAFLSLAELEGDLIACGSADGTIRVVDAGAPARAPRTLRGHAGWVWALAALEDGLLASGSEDGFVRLWDPASGECLGAHSPERGPVHCLTTVDRDTVVAGYADGHLIVYEIDRKRGVFQPIEVIAAHEGEVYDVVAVDAQHIVSGGEDGWARVFRLRDGTCVDAFEHGAFVRGIATIGGRIATGGYDGLIKLWERDLERKNQPVSSATSRCQA